MATKSVVVTGNLPTSGTSNLTVSGFGTVDAAIFIVTEANTTNDPAGNAVVGYGLYDGVSPLNNAYSGFSADGVTTTNTQRLMFATSRVFYGEGGSYSVDATATTDGVTLSAFGSTSVSRKVTAIFIGGASDVHLAVQDMGTGTSAIDITAPGFKPDIVFFASICLNGNPTTTSSTNFVLSFGVAHNNSSNVVSQGAIYLHSQHGQGTANTETYATDSYAVGQLFNGAVAWQASASDFDTNGFSLTPTASAVNDDVSYLAIKLADPDDAWVDIINAATSTGNDAHTGIGFEPQVISLFASHATSLNTITSGLSISIGASDGTRGQSLSVHDEDAVGTTNANSESDASSIINLLDDGGADNAIATLSSLDSDGFTLNYSDAAAAANKILAFAIGDSTAGGGGPSVNINGSTVSWNGLTSYNWNGIA